MVLFCILLFSKSGHLLLQFGILLSEVKVLIRPEVLLDPLLSSLTSLTFFQVQVAFALSPVIQHFVYLAIEVLVGVMSDTLEVLHEFIIHAS